jgi:predicted HicB family RNase H-like nuclease
MTNFDPHAYTIIIRRETIDGERVFHGRVVELPDLHAFEDTYQGALDFLVDTIESAKATFDEEGREFPRPAPQDPGYSGRVTIRMPSWLHAHLDHQSKITQTSLNQVMVSMLSWAAGNVYATAPQQNTTLNMVGEPVPLNSVATGSYVPAASVARTLFGETFRMVNLHSVFELDDPPRISVGSVGTNFGPWRSNRMMKSARKKGANKGPSVPAAATPQVAPLVTPQIQLIYADLISNVNISPVNSRLTLSLAIGRTQDGQVQTIPTLELVLPTPALLSFVQQFEALVKDRGATLAKTYEDVAKQMNALVERLNQQ